MVDMDERTLEELRRCDEIERGHRLAIERHTLELEVCLRAKAALLRHRRGIESYRPT